MAHPQAAERGIEHLVYTVVEVQAGPPDRRERDPHVVTALDGGWIGSGRDGRHTAPGVAV